MNNGKICISVCAETADELIEQIKRAEDLADVIEIRFDCLNKSEFDLLDLDQNQAAFSKILKGSIKEKKLVFTFRSKEQGGNKKLSMEERHNFWGSGWDHWGADLEEDIFEDSWYWLYEPKICSHHDFDGVPDNLEEIYERIKSTDLVDVIKIAVQANDIADTIPIWKLLERWKSEKESIKDKKLKEYDELNKELEEINYSIPPPTSFLQIIPIAMGESGKWTRILGLAHGAFLTYAALDSGKETAPGQVSARDLTEVYRAKELDENTEVYGIIGGDTSYTLSPYIHNAAFRFHKLNAVFIPLQVQNLDNFMRRMVLEKSREIELNFKGFAVTIPHKQSIIKYLDEIDETAKTIGAVNTIKIENGKLYGYNTDAHGFIEPLKNAYGDLSSAKVAVIGNGGAARACIYALKKENAEVTVFARNFEKVKDLAEKFQIELKEISKTDFNDFDILVNTTPLGTKGEFENLSIVSAGQIEAVKLVYDLVYNPFQTKLMIEADKVHVPKIGGIAMLIAQAMKQQKIWTGFDAPMKEMSAEVLRRLK